MKQLVFIGFIRDGDYGDHFNALFIGDDTEPIAEILDYKISEKLVSVRYWISDKEKDKEELQESFLNFMIGAAETCYSSAYSDYTGYLWTDQELKIGGHDLLSELYDNIGKFIHLEIDINS